MFNVLATPGDVFQEVKTSPPANTNWLVPVLLASVMGIIYVLVIFSQDAVLHQLREQREKLMEKKLEKLPKEERERVMEMTEKFATPTIFKVFGSFGAVAGSFGWLFFLSLVMWLLGTKGFKADFAFMKAAEVCGLSAIISVLGIIVSMLLVVVTGNVLITPGPALLLKDFDAANKVHQAWAAINVVTLWYMCVLAVGFSKLSGISWLKAFLWLATPWALLKAGTILLGWGGGGM
jgi:Yip1 domain